jgi:hypothetical protein
MHLQSTGSNQMSRLLISPYKPQDWTGDNWTVQIDFQIEPDFLAEAIKKRWLDADVKVSQLPETPVEWVFLSHFMGWLLSDRKSVSITNGPKSSLIEFVLWYRQFIVPSVRLFLMTESSEETLELTTEISANDIEDFVGY